MEGRTSRRLGTGSNEFTSLSASADGRRLVATFIAVLFISLFYATTSRLGAWLREEREKKTCRRSA